MQILNYNKGSSDIDLGDDARALQIAYIIGQKSTIIGQVVISPNLIKNVSQLKFHTKLALVKSFDKGENVKSVESIHVSYKRYIHEKHKTPQSIRKYKAIENILNELTKLAVLQIEAAYLFTGYKPIREILDSQDVFNYLHISTQSTALKLKDHVHPLNVLSLNFDNINQNKIFFIGDNFFLPSFYDSLVRTNNTADTDQLDNRFFFQPLFSIPNLRHLNAPELRFIRTGLTETAVQFWNQVDIWIHACLNGVGFAECKKILQTNVLPIATQMGELLQNHPNLMALGTPNRPNAILEVGVAQIPYSFLLEYFFYFKIIDETIKKEIESQTEYSAHFTHCWPVLYYKIMPIAEFNTLQIDCENMIEPVKKILAID